MRGRASRPGSVSVSLSLSLSFARARGPLSLSLCRAFSAKRTVYIGRELKDESEGGPSQGSVPGPKQISNNASVPAQSKVAVHLGKGMSLLNFVLVLEGGSRQTASLHRIP